MSAATDWLALLRVGAGAGVLWILPWWGVAGLLRPKSAAARISLAFLAGVVANVASSYVLIVVGRYTPWTGLVAHGVLAAVALVWSVRRRAPSAGIMPWPLALAAAGAVALRLPDALAHFSLGGNDPWGHFVLCKALAAGDAVAAFHPFSFYPRGYHALVLTLHAVSGVTIYDIMRLFSPLLAVVGVFGAYALAHRVSGRFGGLAAAFIYAVPPYRHLVLPSLQTALEPDRFAFAFLPAVILLVMDMVETPSKTVAVALLISEMVHLLIHPLSVQFSVGWIACGAAAAILTRRRVLPLALTSLAVMVFAWGYFHVMRTAYGIHVMPHLSPVSALAVGGFGIDIRRVVLGTGWQVEAMDLLGLALAGVLIWRGLRLRDPLRLLLALVLLHTTYAATRDALYLGDFGHAPPYYAMAFAWVAGGLAGDDAFASWRGIAPLGCMAVLLGHRIMSGGITPLPCMVLAAAGVLAAGCLAAPRIRESLAALFVGVALFSLRPQPVAYPHLGYPEAVRWAHELLSAPPGVVFSAGLISRMPDGTPFPTQDPVRAIVWPRHRPAPLEVLLTRPPDHRWPRTEPVYAVVETEPHGWGFPYFAGEERTALMERVVSWLAERTRRGAPVRTVESTGRMLLIALHDAEEGC